MTYVLDSSVAYKWEVPEPDSDKAIRLRDDFRGAIHDLIAPDFFSVELAHALTKAERRKPPVIAVGDAEGIVLAGCYDDAARVLPIPSDIAARHPDLITVSHRRL